MGRCSITRCAPVVVALCLCWTGAAAGEEPAGAEPARLPTSAALTGDGTADPVADPLADRITRLRGGTLRLVWRPGRQGRLDHFRRAIAWVESEAEAIVRVLGARPAEHPALSALVQGEVLEDAWSLVEHAELVGVPPEHERALRRAVAHRVEPLRCQAVERYLEAAQLARSDAGAASIRWAALDRLSHHGDTVIRRCWRRGQPR